MSYSFACFPFSKEGLYSVSAFINTYFTVVEKCVVRNTLAIGSSFCKPLILFLKSLLPFCPPVWFAECLVLSNEPQKTHFFLNITLISNNEDSQQMPSIWGADISCTLFNLILWLHFVGTIIMAIFGWERGEAAWSKTPDWTVGVFIPHSCEVSNSSALECLITMLFLLLILCSAGPCVRIPLHPNVHP